MLRHTFATDLYRDSGNIRLVQKALGHSDLSTTMIYTHVYDEEVEVAMKNLRSAAIDHNAQQGFGDRDPSLGSRE